MRRRRKNVTIIHNEIDYDKLADAIVRAQRCAENEESKSRVTSITFAKIISIFFKGMAIISVPVACVLSFCLWNILNEIWVATGFWKVVWYCVETLLSFGVGFILGTFSYLFWKSANEIKEEKDKHYIVAVFSGLVSFTALIVALVTLIKG